MRTQLLAPSPPASVPLRGTLGTHLLGDNVALLICELFLSHLLPWNILKLIFLELEKGRKLDIDKWEFKSTNGG